MALVAFRSSPGTADGRMAGMLRRLVTLLAVLSLVLFLVTCALWVRGFWFVDAMERGDGRGAVGASSQYGTLTIYKKSYSRADASEPLSLNLYSDDIRIAPLIRWGEFKFERERMHAGGKFFGIGFPCWFLMTLSIPLPFWRAVTIIRHLKRRRNGCCSTCGYDLRATPGRCPECGSVPNVSKVKA